jgi:hypothetical protein
MIPVLAPFISPFTLYTIVLRHSDTIELHVICSPCIFKNMIKTTIHGKICITPLSTLNQYQPLGFIGVSRL